MLSSVPFDPSQIDAADLENQLLRLGMTAELDAINLYEQLETLSKDPLIKKTFQSIAKQEKEHMGELETLLLRHDAEQIAELKEGTSEVEKLDK